MWNSVIVLTVFGAIYHSIFMALRTYELGNFSFFLVSFFFFLSISFFPPISLKNLMAHAFATKTQHCLI